MGWGPGRPRILVTGGRREKDLSAQPQEPQANPWLSQAHEHRRRAQRSTPPPPQGAQAAHGERPQEVAVTAARRPETFSRAGRLTRRPDYLAVQERGRRVSGSSYLLLALPRQGAPTKDSSNPKPG